MNENETAGELIAELLNDPAKFKDQGNTYQLLQEYFNGHPIETLHPLLKHPNTLVQHAAAWIASELGREAGNLIDEVIP